MRMRRGLLIVLVLAVLAIAGVAWLRTSLPQTRGTLAVPGLDQPVDIVRDAHGVPHILAADARGAWFGIGFAHAQDRLWQMDMNRRIGQGRIAELMGPEAAKTDRFIRTLGLYRRAQADYARLDAPTRAMLRAYADGVNAYLATRKGALPPEFLLLGARPEPWQPADSIVWLKLLALDMAYQWRVELNRFRLLDRLTKAQIEALYPPYPGAAWPQTADWRTLYADLPETFFDRATNDLDEETRGRGSNNWVVAGHRTSTGKPMLANDPHLILTTPSVWYLAHIRIGDHDIVGGTMPSYPTVILGRTGTLAWGFTNTAPDAVDLVLERVTDPGANRYAAPDGERVMQVRTEVIRVRGGSDIRFNVRETANGPIISDGLPGLSRRLGPGFALAFRWAEQQGLNTTPQAGLQLNMARTPADLRAAVRGFVAPQQNIVYADTQGAIGYIAPGRVPVRRADSPTQGLVPAPGALSATAWQGFVPFDLLPQQTDPAEGFIATANQKIDVPGFSATLTHEWELPARHDRIVALLNARAKHSMASMRAIQADRYDALVVRLRDDLLKAGPFAALPADMAAALKAWDGQMRPERSEPLILTAWQYALTRRIYADELGAAFGPLRQQRAEFLHAVLTDAGNQARWCDDIATRPAETCRQQVARALDDALSDLRRAQGADWTRWRWDRAHIARQEHRPLSNLPLVGRLFEIDVPVGGGADSINVAHMSFETDRPYDVKLGPSYRAIYDLADLDRSRYIIPTGQSGNPFSIHFRDMVNAWRAVEGVAIATAPATLRQRGETLTLRPAPRT